jgi:O-antigen/teichoic acid export membrane protein
LAPRLIIASVIGPTALGLFTIAARISDLMCQILLYPATHVAHLKFLRLHGDPKAVSDAFEALLGRLALVAFPLALGLAAVAQPLFQTWLGPKWEGAVIATQLMTLTILPWSIFYAASALFMGLRVFWLDQRIQLGLAITTFLAAALAAPYGLNATCAALLLRLLLLMLVPIVFFRIHAQVGLRVLFRALAGPTAAASVMALAVDYVVPTFTAHLGGLLALPALVVLGGVIYVGGVLALAPRHVRSLVEDAWDLAPARLRTAVGR